MSKFKVLDDILNSNIIKSVSNDRITVEESEKVLL